ncbi:hypothetical protein V5N11_036186 [Cardamine amara subsp. amara]|uniref:Tyrosine specific protein phosphatases domain-containing protein n=1 Tax=Cardamine amara subsp. amara TaxID=228776 RepID=A0ABD1C703_CARAN
MKRLRQPSFRDLPQGWLNCPRFGQEIGFIIPSKVPLSESYNNDVPCDKRYTFKQWLTNGRKKLGLVIDLTNTTRYYHPTTELEQEGIDYVKIRCCGRDSVPDDLSVNKFIYEVNHFEEHNFSKKYVLVHCTHGHNRTGFMIAHYLMRTRPMMRVTQALKMFSDVRPPGIYKPDYIDALYSFYHEVKPESFVCPPTPEWKRSEKVKNYDDDDALSYLEVQGNNQLYENVKKMSNDDILGAEIPLKQELSYKNFYIEMLNIKVKGGSMSFQGSHPVSLDREGFQLLRQRYYYATWKADGTRYMMLLTRDGCYLIDRNFRFRRVQMRFPCWQDKSDYKVHHNTLLDGEMVVDTFMDGQRKWCQLRRFLVYDLAAINGHSLAERPFSERWSILNKQVIKPRNDEKKITNHWYRYEMEPFGVQIKPFCLLSAVEKKLFKELIPNLSHETDEVMVVDHPASYCGKIIECCWDKEKRVWVSMRIRVDKSEPNGIMTARSVIKSINDNITVEVLLEEIKDIIRLPMYVERIRMDIQEAERLKHGNRKALINVRF